MALFGRRSTGEVIRVRVVIRGRIGDGWYDVDQRVALAKGTTLGQLIDAGDRHGLPLRAAVEHSPHLAHTLMWNGERTPVAAHRDRPLAEGDELFLLAPLAGG